MPAATELVPPLGASLSSPSSQAGVGCRESWGQAPRDMDMVMARAHWPRAETLLSPTPKPHALPQTRGMSYPPLGGQEKRAGGHVCRAMGYMVQDQQRGRHQHVLWDPGVRQPRAWTAAPPSPGLQRWPQPLLCSCTIQKTKGNVQGTGGRGWSRGSCGWQGNGARGSPPPPPPLPCSWW